jgi:hypothetical protein
MTNILEDLASLSPKRLTKRLETLADDGLPCHAVNVFSGSPEEGLTVSLSIKTRARPDVLDLARVLETEPGGQVTTAWSLLSPKRSLPHWRLLLHVRVERPVTCEFVVRFDIHNTGTDVLRPGLPELLAATGFALVFDGVPVDDVPALWVPAPTSKAYVLDVLSAVGV